MGGHGAGCSLLIQSFFFFFIYAKHLHVLFHYPLRLNIMLLAFLFNQHSIKDDGQREPANGLHV